MPGAVEVDPEIGRRFFDAFFGIGTTPAPEPKPEPEAKPKPKAAPKPKGRPRKRGAK